MPRRKRFQFIEDEADEADSNDSDFSEELQMENNYQEENQRIREINQRRIESQRQFEERYRLFQELDQYEDNEFSPISDDVDSNDIIDNFDTNVFRIQVQKTQEAGIMLLMMYFSEEHPNIISVIYNPKMKGLLFVETKQEIYLKNLVRAVNLHHTNPEIVDKEHYLDLINTRTKINIRPGQWVRVRKHKLYAKDLAKVLSVNPLKQTCKLKLLKRIKNVHGSEKLPISFVIRRNLVNQGVDDQLQQMFNQQDVQVDDQQEQQNRVTQTQVQSQFIYHDIEAECQLAKVDGFHVLNISTKNVITDIQINEDELKLFFPDVTDRRELVRQAQRELMHSVDFDFKIGDKVRIIGQEESHEFTVVNKDDNNMLELENKELQLANNEKLIIHASQVKMSFSLYQDVKIVDGPYKGNCGIIIEIGKNYCLIDCGDKQIFKAPFSVLCQGRHVYTKNFELVRYGQSELDVGCVITQKEKSLTLLTLDNKRLDCLKVNIQKIDHRYWFEHNDQGQQIKCQDNVIVRFGKYKDKKALVLHLRNKMAYLYNREFPDSVILEDISNLYLLTSGGDQMMQAINKKEYKKYLGKYIKVKNGQWMGYQGQIIQTVNDKFKIQLTTKAITLHVPIQQYIDQL